LSGYIRNIYSFILSILPDGSQASLSIFYRSIHGVLGVSGRLCLVSDLDYIN